MFFGYLNNLVVRLPRLFEFLLKSHSLVLGGSGCAVQSIKALVGKCTILL